MLGVLAAAFDLRVAAKPERNACDRTDWQSQFLHPDLWFRVRSTGFDRSGDASEQLIHQTAGCDPKPTITPPPWPSSEDEATRNQGRRGVCPSGVFTQADVPAAFAKHPIGRQTTER